MINALQDRTPRERTLIYGLIGLSVFFVIWMLLIGPLMSAKTIAQSQQAGAFRDLQVVRSGAAILQPVSSAPQQKLDQTLLVQKTREAGVNLSRLQPDPNGALRIWSEAIESAKLYSFLQTLTQSYAVNITRIQIDRRDDGLVDVQMTLSPL